MINNKNVQDLSINGKTVQSIKDLNTNKIIYTKSDDVQPIVYNPSFSFNTTNSTVTGSDLDPSYDYIVVERNEDIYDVLNSEILETSTSYNLYDVEIYYCNPSETQEIINSVSSEYFTFKGLHEEYPDSLMYYGSLKDMIRVNSVSSSTIHITLHDFYDGNGMYSCNAVDSNGKGLIGGSITIRSDPTSIKFLFNGGKTGEVISNPVTITLYDSGENVIQTKTVNME